MPLWPNLHFCCFDEPLSNLDRELREGLALEIGSLLRVLGLSAVYVTHDQSEAFAIGDRVAVMLGGEIAQITRRFLPPLIG